MSCAISYSKTFYACKQYRHRLLRLVGSTPVCTIDYSPTYYQLLRLIVSTRKQLATAEAPEYCPNFFSVALLCLLETHVIIALGLSLSSTLHVVHKMNNN